MKVNRKVAVGAAIAFILAFLFLVPVVYYAPPPGAFACPANGCNFLRYGSVTYEGFGVGGTWRDVTGYSISFATASTPVSSSSSVSYSVTAEPTHTAKAVVDSANNLQLQLSLNASSSSASGIMVSVTVDERSTLATTNNLTAANEWPLTLNGLNGPPCWPGNYPVGLAIAEGHYASSNMTLAKFLDLVNPGATFGCPAGLSDIARYVFQPMNDSAMVYGSCGTGPCLTEKVSVEVTAGGYWSQNGGGFTSFPKGTYTVLAEDEWGTSAIAYFTVS